MKFFLLSILLMFLLLSPFYIFRSGLPQPADVLIALGSFVFLFSGTFFTMFNRESIVKHLFRFILLVVIINIIHWFNLYAIEGTPNTLFFPPLYYIFNFLFFLTVIFVLKDQTKERLDLISFFIILSLVIQFSLAMLGIQGGSKESINRPTLFFNNPNQLGYWALLMLTLFTVLPSRYRKNKLSMALVIGISTYLILYSGSRAALGGVLILSALMIFKEGFKLNFASAFLILVTLVSIPVAMQTDFIQKKIELIERRSDRNVGKNISELEYRGYDRMWIHPEYLFYGAGEGKYDRFDSVQDKEMHSGIGTILFSYGILGLILFLIFVYRIIEYDKFYNLLLLSPLLIYNVTHQGLRETLLWMVFGIVYFTSSTAKSTTKKVQKLANNI